jgi:hypothetical protein
VGSAYSRGPAMPTSHTEFNLVQLNVEAGNEQPGFYYLWDPSIDW